MGNNINSILNKLNTWWATFIENIPNIAIAITVMFIAYFASKLVYKTVFKVTKKRIDQVSIAKLIARTGSVIIVLTGLFLALGALNLGKALTGLLSAAGISGLVIGLALQGTLSNTLSGIILSFRENLRLGNWIETNGYAGEVIDINLNYFVLKETDNNIVVLPNKAILESPFKNFSLTNKMRITIECGVGYESDLEKVQELTMSVIASHFDQEELGEKIDFFYTEYGDSSINFICRYWIYGENGLAKLNAKSKAILETQKAFDTANINIPFPIITVKFDSDIRLQSTK